MCVHRKEELVMFAHNANIKDNFSKLPFVVNDNFSELPFMGKEHLGVQGKKRNNINQNEDNCIILKTFLLWLKKNSDSGFAIRGYDAKNICKV